MYKDPHKRGAPFAGFPLLPPRGRVFWYGNPRLFFPRSTPTNHPLWANPLQPLVCLVGAKNLRPACGVWPLPSGLTWDQAGRAFWRIFLPLMRGNLGNAFLPPVRGSRFPARGANYPTRGANCLARGANFLARGAASSHAGQSPQAGRPALIWRQNFFTPHAGRKPFIHASGAKYKNTSCWASPLPTRAMHNRALQSARPKKRALSSARGRYLSAWLCIGLIECTGCLRFLRRFFDFFLNATSTHCWNHLKMFRACSG